jgi:hypothetical protein
MSASHATYDVGGRFSFKARPLAAVFAACLPLFLSACAQVTVVTNADAPRSEWKWGVLAIELGKSDQNSLAAISGIGAFSGPFGTVIGLARTKVVRMGDECRIVIATSDLAAILENPELMRTLKASYNACLA